jgi:hypothetical protein
MNSGCGGNVALSAVPVFPRAQSDCDSDLEPMVERS